MDIEQNIEILWYIFIFLPQGYGALLRFVSKSFKEAVDTNYEPVYTDLISKYGLKPNLIEQFRLGYTIDMCSRSKSKWLKLLRWSRKYYPDTDILLLYACSLDNDILINSICNISQLPPKNVNMCLDCAFKNGNILMIKKIYECVKDLTVEHLLWLSIIHNQIDIGNWLFDKGREQVKSEILQEMGVLLLALCENDPEKIIWVSYHYLSFTVDTLEEYKAVLSSHAIDKAEPFYYHG